MTKPITKLYTFRFPIELLDRLEAAVDKLRPRVVTKTQAVEIAVLEWLERNEPKERK